MDIEVYCDESRQEFFRMPPEACKDQYVLLGSLWIEASLREELKSKIKELQRIHDVSVEFKWNRVSPSRLTFYKELVSLFFDEPMRFRCIVLPADKLDAVQFHKADNELMFYKFYYLLLRDWIHDFNQYRVFVDVKTNRIMQRLAHLRIFLDRSNFFADVVSVQALPSHEVVFLQLVDIMIGAVGYHFHGGGVSSAKKEIIETIEKKLGHQIRPTLKSEEKFNIFKWIPGGGW